MTRYEYAKQTPQDMAIMAAYCIATYLEAIDYHKFSTEELNEFLNVTSEDLEKWLNEEQE